MATQFWNTVLSPFRATAASITGTLKKKRQVSPDEYHDFSTRSTLQNQSLRLGEPVAGSGFATIGFGQGIVHPVTIVSGAGRGLNPDHLADTNTPPSTVGDGSALDATAAGIKLENTRQLHKAAVKMSAATRTGKAVKLPLQ